LQAVKALNHAKSISPSHPEVHVRIVELQRAKPPTSEPQVSIFKGALLPDDLPLDRYNAEYIQKNPSSAAAAVAFAKVSKLLGASQEEFEELLNGVTKPEIELTIPVSHPFQAF
jgi:N-alpha-acetyltransferase 15/16, NatA auxiliary subunit